MSEDLSEVKRRLQSAWEALATQEEEIARLRADLDRERALADRLAREAGNVDYMERPHCLDRAIADHRKARGL